MALVTDRSLAGKLKATGQKLLTAHVRTSQPYADTHMNRTVVCGFWVQH